MQLSAAQGCKNFEATTAQSREIWELTRKIATETCRSNQEELCRHAAEGVLVLSRTFRSPTGSAGTSAPREGRIPADVGLTCRQYRKSRDGGADGRRHDQMPRDGARYPDGHESGSGEVFAAVRCFSRAPSARSARPVTNGLPGRPGFTSREEKRRKLKATLACNQRRAAEAPAATPSMAPRAGAGHSLARRVALTAPAASANKAARSRGCRTGPGGDHLLRQDDPTDPAAHELVALACCCFEPRPVDLNEGPPIGSDRTRRRGACKRHASPSFAARQEIPQASPASAAGCPRQADRGRAATISPDGLRLSVAHCRPQRAEIVPSVPWRGFEPRHSRRCCGRAPLEIGPAKSATRSPPPAPPRSSESGKAPASTGCPQLPRCRRRAVATVCPLGISMMKAIKPAKGEIDLFYYVTRPHQHGVTFKRDHSEMRHKEFKVCWRQSQLTVDYQLWPCAPSRESSFPDGCAVRCRTAAGVRLHANKQTAPSW